MSRKRQRGLYIVEYAVVGSLFFMLMFGSFEVSRLFYTWSALDAATQRGARVAAVCDPADVSTVQSIAVFGDGSTTNSPVIPGVSAADINVEYLDEDNAVTAAIVDMRYVRVSVQNYTHQWFIPMAVGNALTTVFTPPDFSTVRPVESLGFDGSSGRDC